METSESDGLRTYTETRSIVLVRPFLLHLRTDWSQICDSRSHFPPQPSFDAVLLRE